MKFIQKFAFFLLISFDNQIKKKIIQDDVTFYRIDDAKRIFFEIPFISINFGFIIN